MRCYKRNLDLRYETEGYPLPELPAACGPHYIPRGGMYLEQSSLIESGRVVLEYKNADGGFIQILMRTAKIHPE